MNEVGPENEAIAKNNEVESEPPSSPEGRPPAPRLLPQGEQRALRFWACLLVVAFLTSALLVPGMRGAVIGISKLLDRMTWGTAVLAQATAVLGLLLAVHLELYLLRSPSTPVLLRAVSVPTSAVAVTLVMNSATQPLTSSAILSLNACVLLLAAASAVTALARGLRAAHAGPVISREHIVVSATLSLATGIGFLGAGARWLLLEAERIGPRALRMATEVAAWLATVSWCVSVGLIVLTAGLVAGRRLRSWLGLMITATLAAWVIVRDRASVAGQFDAALSRALTKLQRAPLAEVPSVVLGMVDALALVLAVWVLLSGRVERRHGFVASVCLVASRALDMPLLCLALLLGALAAIPEWWTTPETRTEPG